MIEEAMLVSALIGVKYALWQTIQSIRNDKAKEKAQKTEKLIQPLKVKTPKKTENVLPQRTSKAYRDNHQNNKVNTYDSEKLLIMSPF